MDPNLIKHRLLDKHLRLIDVTRRTGIAYDRLVRIVHGYRPATRKEIEAIADILELPVDDLNPDSACSE